MRENSSQEALVFLLIKGTFAWKFYLIILACSRVFWETKTTLCQIKVRLRFFFFCQALVIFHSNVETLIFFNINKYNPQSVYKYCVNIIYIV